MLYNITDLQNVQS